MEKGLVVNNNTATPPASTLRAYVTKEEGWKRGGGEIAGQTRLSTPSLPILPGGLLKKVICRRLYRDSRQASTPFSFSPFSPLIVIS